MTKVVATLPRKRLPKTNAQAISWEPLKEGDTVDIVSPASQCTKAEFLGAIKYIKSLGLNPQYPENLFGKDPFSSNSDKWRFKHLRDSIYSKDSKALWCLRGGYGSGRLLSELSRMKAPAKSKLFVGFSDITYLHNFLNNFWGWSTIHGPLLCRLGTKHSSQKELKDIKNLIFGHTNVLEYSNLKPLNTLAKKSKILKGSVVGGNLRIAEAILGTPWQTKMNGKILFFEDVNERGYSIDRILVHFAQAGYFKGVNAVVFGDFVGGTEKGGKQLVNKALERFAAGVNFPVLKGIKAGHGKIQRPVPFFTKSILQTGATARLIVSTGAKI